MKKTMMFLILILATHFSCNAFIMLELTSIKMVEGQTEIALSNETSWIADHSAHLFQKWNSGDEIELSSNGRGIYLENWDASNQKEIFVKPTVETLAMSPTIVNIQLIPKEKAWGRDYCEITFSNGSSCKVDALLLSDRWDIGQSIMITGQGENEFYFLNLSIPCDKHSEDLDFYGMLIQP